MRRTISLPEKPVKRKRIFSFRLTDEERDAIRKFANELEVSPSHLVRHLTMSAIFEHQGGSTIEEDH